jgi:predicted HicB family RNase H-like nuclease
MATNQARLGRPSLGERMRVPVRMPPEVYEALRVEAKSRGISMSQYMADLAAIHLGLPQAALKLDQQEEIPAA